ncbi:MAG: acyltransferase [Lachnospiraceae bacterium]|nr:acyltransferase [Lachnospiraceae bacterium]
MEKKKREANLELLRILSMCMVIGLHYLGKGNALKDMAEILPGNPNYINEVLAWYLEALCYGAVNLYIMISGYFLINSTVRFEKLSKLIIQVFFYSAGIYLIIRLLGYYPKEWEDGYHKSIMILPISLQHYWFASVYAAFYMLAPFLAVALRKLKKKEHFGVLLILLFLFMRFLKLFSYHLIPLNDDGMGIIWMITVFVLAAYIRRFVPIKAKRRFLYLAAGVLSLLATAAGSFLVAFLYQKTGKLDGYIDFLFAYNSPTVVVGSTFLFLFFRTVRIPDGFVSKTITAVSPLTFGVYLLHDHFLLRDLWVKIWKVDRIFETPYFVLHFIAVVLTVFIICALAEWIRNLVFGLIYKIKPVRTLFHLIGKADVIFPKPDDNFEEAKAES